MSSFGSQVPFYGFEPPLVYTSTSLHIGIEPTLELLLRIELS